MLSIEVGERIPLGSRLTQPPHLLLIQRYHDGSYRFRSHPDMMAKDCSYRTWAIEAELREATIACRRRKVNLELDTASSVVAQWRSTHGSALPES